MSGTITEIKTMDQCIKFINRVTQVNKELKSLSKKYGIDYEATIEQNTELIAAAADKIKQLTLSM